MLNGNLNYSFYVSNDWFWLISKNVSKIILNIQMQETWHSINYIGYEVAKLKFLFSFSSVP